MRRVGSGCRVVATPGRCPACCAPARTFQSEVARGMGQSVGLCLGASGRSGGSAAAASRKTHEGRRLAHRHLLWAALRVVGLCARSVHCLRHHHAEDRCLRELSVGVPMPYRIARKWASRRGSRTSCARVKSAALDALADILHPRDERNLNDRRKLVDGGAERRAELETRESGPARRDEIVNEQHAIARFHRPQPCQSTRGAGRPSEGVRAVGGEVDTAEMRSEG